MTETRSAGAERWSDTSDERSRIARDLHDVIAHHISLINVQAGVALHLIESRPEQAYAALEAIKHASKEVLVEVRSIIGLLRPVDGNDPAEPTPGLAWTHQLVGRTRRAGIEVAVQTVGEPRTLPRDVDIAAYRIVQEALTNVIRHSWATTTVVTIRYRTHQLCVDIDDNGRGCRENVLGGSGLEGMRERAELLGGALRTGRSKQGGFSVKAILPTDV